jgi:hypothetical protein
MLFSILPPAARDRHHAVSGLDDLRDLGSLSVLSPARAGAATAPAAGR